MRRDLRIHPERYGKDRKGGDAEADRDSESDGEDDRDAERNRDSEGNRYPETDCDAEG